MNWKVTFSDSNNKSDKIPGRSWMQNKRGSSKLLFVIGRSTTAPGEARQTTNVSTAAPSLSWLSWRWCNGVLCFISLFVHPRQRAGASWPPAFWEKPYSEMRIPTCFMLSLHISLHSRCLLHVFVCVRACVRVCVCVQEFHIGRKWPNWWSDPTHREKSVVWVSKQWKCVRARERERERHTAGEWDNIPKNPSVPLAFAPRVPSRDRTSHVGFQNSSQFLLHKDGHISTAAFTTAKKVSARNAVQLWYKCLLKMLDPNWECVFSLSCDEPTCNTSCLQRCTGRFMFLLPMEKRSLSYLRRFVVPINLIAVLNDRVSILGYHMRGSEK